MDIAAAFEKHKAQSNVRDTPVLRKDLVAFNLLDRLVPGRDRIIAGAEHDKIALSTDVAALAKVATDDDILSLVRCGVFYDSADEYLWMFT